MEHIDEARFKHNFDSLSRIGAIEFGGVDRPTFSESHSAARAWFKNTSITNGLDFFIDNAGNHIAQLNTIKGNAPTLILGSHLDSVPNGGRFDGALGVVSALEVLLTIKEKNIDLPFNIHAIDFTDEEGIFVSFLGSSAFAGSLSEKDLENPRCGRKILVEKLDHIGLSEKGLLNLDSKLQFIIGYLELHIEQASRLTESNTDIGIVTSIVGINSYRLRFIGQEDHAGTAPMERRRNAALGASQFILESNAYVLQNLPSCSINVGQISLEPGAFNVVPKYATLSLEIRAPDISNLENLENECTSIAQKCAKRYKLDFQIEHLKKQTPTQMDKAFQKCIEDAAKSLELTAIPMISKAGHDAESFNNICPTGMIFVPSKDGISHSPHEFTPWKDCINGANVLLKSVLEFNKNIYHRD